MTLSRRSLFRLAGTTAALSLTACSQSAPTSSAAPVPTLTTAPAATAAPTMAAVTNGDEALARLLDGNARYVAAKMNHPDQSLDRRAEVAKGQHPFAIVLTCADSRVPPELLFDQGLGDLFVLRVAGNIVDDAVLGSIEYAVGEFAVPLVVVLGHKRCGAVKATLENVEHGGEVPGHIGSLVKAIMPAIEHAKSQQGDQLDNAVRANATMVRDQIASSAPLLSGAVAANKLKVASAYYDLDMGEVKVL